jgi:hypothetical protein
VDISKLPQRTLLKLIVFHYSTQVKTADQFAAVKKTLLRDRETDRAGAASNNVVAELANELRRRWEGTFDAFEMAWEHWASDILMETQGANAHMRSSLINRAPPSELISLFRSRETPAKTQISNLNSVNRIGLSMIESLQNQMNQIQSDHGTLGVRIDSFQQMLTGFYRQMEATSRTVGLLPERTSAIQALGRVPNIEDIQHQILPDVSQQPINNNDEKMDI